MEELSDSISKSHDSAPGPDQIHYQMLKHLPPESQQVLLAVFNNIWVTGKFPDSWRVSTVIPVPKPGKDTSDPSNYRPISLTNCLCKIMERMINDRLVWYLERNKIFNSVQCGFRKSRSTTDHLVRLESFIREAFVQRQHVVAVFFDLEKAYERTRKYGIMRDLHKAGLRGRLPSLIENFLKNRQFQVRLGTCLSQLYDQDMGVPQGSILSVTLFGLKINSIVKCISPGVECSLFVDDFVICYRSKHLHIIERHLQQCLNKLSNWADENGFKFSTSKTVCVHFCRLRKIHPEPALTLNGTAVPVVEETKFLGVIFDKKLTFLPHIRHLKEKCTKALNLLRIIAHTTWGADQESLLHLYRSLIRSKLDYGCVVYGSARRSYIKMLDPIQNHALRLCLGAFRTSPSTSLHVEANEPPLHIRRKRLSLQYSVKLCSNSQNPAYSCVFKSKYINKFAQKPNQIAPLGIRLSADLQAIGLKSKELLPYSVPSVPPWTLVRPVVDFSMHTYAKDETSSVVFLSRFYEICDQYKNFIRVFTDGSKAGARVSAAAVCGESTKSVRLPDHVSIFTAELYALNLALGAIRNKRENNFLILTDSLSSLEAINSFKIENSLVLSFIRDYTKLASNGKQIVICWVPSHVGIRGNEKADAAAKSALNLPVTATRYPARDLLPRVNSLCQREWQRAWDEQTSNKLFEIKPLIGKSRSLSHLGRRENTIINRLRIGHTRLTHKHLLSGDHPPVCEKCNCVLTVKHILLECSAFKDIRNKHFTSTSIKDVFENTESFRIISFIREINFYHLV